MPQVSKPVAPPELRGCSHSAHLLFCRSSSHPGQGSWISSCLSGRQSIEMCPPPSQGTGQSHRCPRQAVPVASLPGGKGREGIQQAEGGSQGTPSGLRPTHPTR